jgi:hypothetical protein
MTAKVIQLPTRKTLAAEVDRNASLAEKLRASIAVARAEKRRRERQEKKPEASK